MSFDARVPSTSVEWYLLAHWRTRRAANRMHKLYEAECTDGVQLTFEVFLARIFLVE